MSSTEKLIHGLYSVWSVNVKNFALCHSSLVSQYLLLQSNTSPALYWPVLKNNYAAVKYREKYVFHLGNQAQVGSIFFSH